MAEILLGGKRLGELKVTELKNELEKRGLQKKGVKSVLLYRLKSAIVQEALALSDEDMQESCEEPIATMPNNEDQGHMSGAEEAPPTLNPAPAVVPSSDESVREQVLDVAGGSVGGEDGESGANSGDNSLLMVEEDNVDVEGDSDKGTGRLNSVTFDPSYNPNGEELLYEGDVEAEGPPPPKAAASESKEAAGPQDEGFIVNVHETGMELDMAESLPDPHSGVGGGSDKLSWQSSSAYGGPKKATPSTKSASESKKRASGSSPSKTVNRCSMWVSGLVSSVRAMDLQTLFSPFGQVMSAKVVAKSRTKQLRFGFITMATAEEAQHCIQELSGTELKGQKITVELAKSQPPLSKSTSGAKNTASGRAHGTSGSSGSSSEKKRSTSSLKTTIIGLKGGRREDKGSGSKSIADKIVEKSRRSVEVRKVSSNSAEKDRRKSAPIPRRSRSHSRERASRSGHRPRPHSRHVSVHSRLGAIPSSRGGDVMRRDMEQDLYLRDRERQVELRLQERRLEHSRHQEITIRRQMEAERSRREHDMARREHDMVCHMQEIRERDNRQREMRERQMANQEWLFKEKERELREREFRERQRREVLEQELREREARENQFREREKRIKEMHDKEIRERDVRVAKEREMRDREARMQAERERELRDRERRLKEEQERIEQERRAHEEQQRWIREEAARVVCVKEEAARLEREREEAERREHERRQCEEKKRQQEELRAKREREQKCEREEMEKRLQSQSSSGRLGKHGPYQENSTYDGGKRQALSSDSYMSPSSSVFYRLDPQKGHSVPPRPGGSSVGQGPSGLVPSKELSHVNPAIISAATQALENIRKSVPVPPISAHLPISRGNSSNTSLQAQIQQLAAATALANSNRVGVSGSNLDFCGGGWGGGGSGLGPYSQGLMWQSMLSGGGQMVSKGSGGGSGGGGLGKLPPEEQRYNRCLGGSGTRGRNSGGGGGSWRTGGSGRRPM